MNDEDINKILKIINDFKFKGEPNQNKRNLEKLIYIIFNDDPWTGKSELISKIIEREKLKINNDELIILFFGFIRKYKGLDILLDAMKILNPPNEETTFNAKDA